MRTSFPPRPGAARLRPVPALVLASCVSAAVAQPGGDPGPAAVPAPAAAASAPTSAPAAPPALTPPEGGRAPGEARARPAEASRPTGDLGRHDDAAHLWIAGRKKQLLITAYGRNV